MFDIEYKGGNCILITTKGRSLLVDGNLTAIGLKNLNIDNAVQVATNPRLQPEYPDTSNNLVLPGPGEYEVGDFAIKGIPVQGATAESSGQDEVSSVNTMYRIEIGTVSVGVIGNIVTGLSDDQLEALGVIDILVVPVGGGGRTIGSDEAVKLIRMIEPKAVIPVHYSDPSINYPYEQDDVSKFLGELGIQAEQTTKLKIKGESSIPTTLTVYELTRV